METETKYSFQKLWHILLDKNMTKRELAEKANVSVASLGRLKKGKPISYDGMRRICKVIDCELSDIMDEL